MTLLAQICQANKNSMGLRKRTPSSRHQLSVLVCAAHAGHVASGRGRYIDQSTVSQTRQALSSDIGAAGSKERRTDTFAADKVLCCTIGHSATYSDFQNRRKQGVAHGHLSDTVSHLKACRRSSQQPRAFVWFRPVALANRR